MIYHDLILARITRMFPTWYRSGIRRVDQMTILRWLPVFHSSKRCSFVTLCCIQRVAYMDMSNECCIARVQNFVRSGQMAKSTSAESLVGG
ncbi:hypothetical protein BSN85_21840 [Bradyrhizobium brasilense]|nr:hypothetical protein BSN85_21840 [Bradyrhizobium brasilense]